VVLVQAFDARETLRADVLAVGLELHDATILDGRDEAAGGFADPAEGVLSS
jgi:hypothetical protein